MKIHSINDSNNTNLNPLFQQQLHKGPVQEKDLAFFKRKQSFMQGLHQDIQDNIAAENKNTEDKDKD